MELRHLRYFATVADAGGFSQAAARLNVSQPALWRQIRDFENELGVRLFQRVGRRVVLTAEGDDLVKRSHDLLAAVDSFSDRARTLKSGETGILRVGATPQTLESLLPGFLARYRRSHPGVEVHLIEDGAPQLLTRLEQGEFHLAVTMAGHEGLRSRLLFPVRVLAVMPAAHRLRRPASLEVTNLAGEPLLLLSRHFGSRLWFDGACHLAHLRPLVRLESAAPHTLIALAQAGYGIAIVPSNVQFIRRNLRVACVLQSGRSLGRWMGVNWDPRRFLPPYAERFAEELAAYTRRSYPGKEFDRATPPVARPSQQATLVPISRGGAIRPRRPK